MPKKRPNCATKKSCHFLVILQPGETTVPCVVELDEDLEEAQESDGTK